MLAPSKKWQPVIRQVQGDTPGILSNILENDVNLAIWQRQMPAHIEDFAALLLSLGEPLAEYLPLNVDGGDIEPDLRSLAVAYADVKGYEGFIADVAWLVSAYACLLGARCVGLRLRALDSAMCPRFHVDHVPVRLITTYAGIGSQWLKEGLIDRQQLGNPLAEPEDAQTLRQINCGDVALLKGERWIGNEGYGLVHRSPPLRRGERRLLLSLDWLA